MFFFTLLITALTTSVNLNIASVSSQAIQIAGIILFNLNIFNKNYLYTWQLFLALNSSVASVLVSTSSLSSQVTCKIKVFVLLSFALKKYYLFLNCSSKRFRKCEYRKSVISSYTNHRYKYYFIIFSLHLMIVTRRKWFLRLKLYF